MELKEFIMRYTFGKPMLLQVYKWNPFRIDFSGYVDGDMLVDEYGEFICSIEKLDTDYYVLEFGADSKELYVTLVLKSK